MPNESYKHFGLLGVAMFWLVATFVIYKFWQHRGSSISAHAATNRLTYLSMAIVQSIMLPMFGLFAIRWLSPTYSLNKVFDYSMLLFVVAFLIAAWIPSIIGTKGKIHGFFASLGMLSGIPVLFIILASSQVELLIKLFSTFALSYLVLGIVAMQVSTSARRQQLIFQITSMLLFDTTLLSMAYL